MHSNDDAIHASPRRYAWISDWGNALTLLITAYALFYLWLMSRSQTALWSHILRALAFLPMNAGAAHARVPCQPPRRYRSAHSSRAATYRVRIRERVWSAT